MEVEGGVLVLPFQIIYSSSSSQGSEWLGGRDTEREREKKSNVQILSRSFFGFCVLQRNKEPRTTGRCGMTSDGCGMRWGWLMMMWEFSFQRGRVVCFWVGSSGKDGEVRWKKDDAEK